MAPLPVIDLRSDTVTCPTPAMREAIFHAQVGDDMTGDDPTVNRLEEFACEVFGMEAAVFACSGTQSNQMAIRAHCQPGDELLINETGHIGLFEAGAPAILSGVTVRQISAPLGKLDLDDLQDKIRPIDQHLVRTRLVCLENTTNVGGGRVYAAEQAARVSQWARSNGLRIHLDGARYFNACVAGGYSAAEFAQHFDTISICLSKGLGCPMGSLLVGDADSIRHARRTRKLLGGALRQAGMMAAAGLYALENHVERLSEDHENAKYLARELAATDGIELDPESVETNLVFFDLDPKLGNPNQLASLLAERNIRIGPSGGQRMRACTHLDVNRADLETVVAAIREFCAEGFSEVEAIGSGPYAR